MNVDDSRRMIDCLFSSEDDDDFVDAVAVRFLLLQRGDGDQASLSY